MDPKLNLNNIQIIRYMGSKRSILSHIIPKIFGNMNGNKLFLDLFAGTNSISYALKSMDGSNAGIITNDNQMYSYVISKALIENNKISRIPLREAKRDLMKKFHYNKRRIEKMWCNKYIARKKYRTKIIKGKKTTFKEFIGKPTHRLPFCLFTFYFSNVYFSIEQCKEIDSLRYAISKIGDEIKRNIYLTCLLYAASYGSSTFGHFAQPRRVTKEVRKIRKKSILELFFKKLGNLNITLSNKKNFCFNEDYKDLFKDKKFSQLKNKIGLIYMDSPYSSANYSRFYHVLETLVRYDYPTCEFKGLYRDDRFQSNFCKKTKVEEEFENVIGFAKRIEASLMISYVNSNLGLLSKRKILKLCRKIFGKDNVTAFHDIMHMHSMLGNRAKNQVREILILCKA